MEQTTKTQSLPGFDTLDATPPAQTQRTPPAPEDRAPTRKTDNAPPRPLGDYPELMTVQEAAEYLSIAPSTCYVLTKQYVDTVGRDGMPARKTNIRTSTAARRNREQEHEGSRPHRRRRRRRR